MFIVENSFFFFKFTIEYALTKILFPKQNSRRRKICCAGVFSFPSAFRLFRYNLHASSAAKLQSV